MEPLKINLPFHEHPLTPVKIESKCDWCGLKFKGVTDGYKCDSCVFGLFHKTCANNENIPHPSQTCGNILYHTFNFYSGERRCAGCREKIYDSYIFICNDCVLVPTRKGRFGSSYFHFNCAKYPPSEVIDVPQHHDHKLKLETVRSCFTCAACGKDCDGYSYKCHECNLKFHVNCEKYPAERCPSYVFHTKCATREDVWDGKEMKNEPEEEEDIQPFTVIDENTIHHVSHKEHNLRLDKSGIFIKDRICEACVYPIYHHSFYSCMSCSFILHESCANLPLWKRHVVSNERYRYKYWDYFFRCMACGLLSNGFKYDATRSILDVRCASVTEPFVHKSHPHPLFYTSPRGVCSVCKKEAHHVLRCVEDDCGYVMDYKCALLPYEVKHSVDHHFLSLCYGEENASGKYWCDICEKETDPKTWFYTSKDCELTLHTDCVLGDFRGLKPGIAEDEYVHHVPRDFKVVRNNSMSRPLCKQCKSRCIFPFFLETWNKNSIHNGYYCSESCFYS
ncbi:unnamed protein product [Arabidopsis lyrata]|nr:unnamed protein product [Arabidopsis lyrata]